MFAAFLKRPVAVLAAIGLSLSAAVALGQSSPLPTPPRLSPVPAQSTPQAVPGAVVQTENVRAELMSELTTIAPGEPFWVGLRQTIRPKWHTYWRNPGDSGLPTELKWQLPAGASAGDIAWPIPSRFKLGPIVNYGYENDVLLPVRIIPPAGLAHGQRFTIDLDASWLVCEEVCIPEEGRLRLTLTVGNATFADAATRTLFETARRQQPIASPWTAEYSAPGAQRLTLVVKASGLRRETISDVYFYPYLPGPIEHSGPQKLTIANDRLELEIVRSLTFATLPATLAGILSIRETIAGSDRPVTQAFEMVVPLVAGAPAAGSAAAPAAEEIGLWQALLFALIGGLILNLMPCVFPVLSMKALALAGHGASDVWHLRHSGLAYTAGVLASFAVIAIALAVLRSGGESLGWGFQFQSPLFTLGVAWLFFVIGLNLSGVFEVGGSLMGLGSGLAAREGHGGSFFTGVLATVVATPCTAPFMAAAIGFALAQPVGASMAVLLAMGLGLALPYLALTFIPGLLRFLPRPGMWMVRFKQVLAFPMYASAAWLVWVLAQQAGNDGVLYALLGMVALGFGLYVWQAGRESLRTVWRHVAAAALLMSVGAGVALAVAVEAIGTVTAPAAAPQAGANWERFSRERLAELRAQGKPVFVNFTAAWCITCLANERVALATEATRKAFADSGVVYLKGDWTNRDPEISAVLKEFGRAGVPLYLLYSGGPDRPAEILPQILTEAEVIGRVERLRTAQAR